VIVIDTRVDVVHQNRHELRDKWAEMVEAGNRQVANQRKRTLSHFSHIILELSALKQNVH
jgi:hypothetical protein